MAALIDKFYFVGIINIDTSRTDVQTVLSDYIDLYEVEMLKMLLGEDLYQNWVANKTDAKYTDLTGGKNYTDDGVSKVYSGIKQMLAYFTYFYFTRDQKSANTVLGEVAGENQNSSPAFPTAKLTRAWNMGLQLYYEAVDFILYMNSQTPDTYPYFEYVDIKQMNSFGI